MVIRNANHADIPEIVSLLKRSLGEKYLPKSERFFIWKHFENPFGKSKILVAEENDTIIGLRAFMYWRWENAQKKYQSVRAVDTATDPAYQGIGIFRKLTLRAIEECLSENTAFVYNSPNAKSYQGYIKMGWHSIGKMPVSFRIGSFFPRLYSDSKDILLNGDYNINFQIKKLDPNWTFLPSTLLSTMMNVPYLSWRYQDCPVSKYGAYIEPNKFGLVFRLKKKAGFYECRICEFWVEKDEFLKDAEAAMLKIIKKVRPLFITSASMNTGNANLKKMKGFFGPYSLGPVITIREISDHQINDTIQFNNWAPSLGSIELF